MVTETLCVGTGNGAVAKLPSTPAGLVCPAPVAYKTTMSPAVAGFTGEFSVSAAVGSSRIARGREGNSTRPPREKLRIVPSAPPNHQVTLSLHLQIRCYIIFTGVQSAVFERKD